MKLSFFRKYIIYPAAVITATTLAGCGAWHQPGPPPPPPQAGMYKCWAQNVAGGRRFKGVSHKSSRHARKYALRMCRQNTVGRCRIRGCIGPK